MRKQLFSYEEALNVHTEVYYTEGVSAIVGARVGHSSVIPVRVFQLQLQLKLLIFLFFSYS